MARHRHKNRVLPRFCVGDESFGEAPSEMNFPNNQVVVPYVAGMETEEIAQLRHYRKVKA